MTTGDALRLLQAEIVQVVGCTEPAAVAYALRTLVRHLQEPLSPANFRAEVRISVDAHRNATTAVVPRLKQSGIRAAAAAGLASRADNFNVFSDFDLPLARAFLKNQKGLTITPVRRRGLWVHAQLPGLRTGITLSGRHDHIERLIVYGKDCTPPAQQLPPPPSLPDILKLARARRSQLEALARDFITRQVPAEKGYSLETQIARRVIGRMTGYSHPVMTITGSGNQGIFIGLPYQRLYAHQGDRILPAVVCSLLTQVLLSAKHQRLSAKCGFATKAAPALAAGLAFARGATPADIERLFRAISAHLKDLGCEGAEPACGDKARRAFRAVGALNLGLP